MKKILALLALVPALALAQSYPLPTYRGVSVQAANPSVVITDTSGTNGAHVTLTNNGTKQWDFHTSSSNGNLSFDRYVSGTYTDTPVLLSGTNGLATIVDGINLSGGSTTSATPVGNPFTAYGNFAQAYTTNLTALPEWGFQINMTSNLGNGQGTPNGDKVAFFSGVNQLAGSGSAWAGNFVAQSASGVGSNGLIGVEIDMNPGNSTIPGSSTPTAPNYTAGLAFSGAGTVPAQAAILISGPSQNWYRGIYFDGQSTGAIAGNSVEDESRAINSYLLNGTHTYGIKGDGGTFSTGFMTIPNGSNIQWKNSGGTLQNGISLDASNNLQMGYGGMGNIIENGSTVPVTNNTLTLGTAALQWSTIYGVNFTASTGISTGTLNATGLITPASAVGIKGTTAADNAQAGSDGEFASNSTTGTSLTTATTANCTSVSLTAGDWDVTGEVRFNPAGTTTIGFEYAGISTTSATLGALGSFVFNGATQAAGTQAYTQAPTVRVNVSATTTVYAVAQASFGTSTMTCDGFIRARRVR